MEVIYPEARAAVWDGGQRRDHRNSGLACETRRAWVEDITTSNINHRMSQSGTLPAPPQHHLLSGPLGLDVAAADGADPNPGQA